ncbi:hypothetical protein B0H13DRAFT_1853644 [Mycena leptocephala]|nr:hypothetical protein B0H13DRAFT_1853644 [Mycena leptocephala]
MRSHQRSNSDYHAEDNDEEELYNGQELLMEEDNDEEEPDEGQEEEEDEEHASENVEARGHDEEEPDDGQEEEEHDSEDDDEQGQEEGQEEEEDEEHASEDVEARGHDEEEPDGGQEEEEHDSEDDDEQEPEEGQEGEDAEPASGTGGNDQRDPDHGQEPLKSEDKEHDSEDDGLEIYDLYTFLDKMINYIPRIVGLLNSGDFKPRTEAKDAICTIAKQACYQSAVVAMIPPIISLFKHTDPHVRFNATAIVRNLAETPTLLKTIKGYIDEIGDFLADSHPMVQAAGATTLGALAKLCADEDSFGESDSHDAPVSHHPLAVGVSEDEIANLTEQPVTADGCKEKIGQNRMELESEATLEDAPPGEEAPRTWRRAKRFDNHPTKDATVTQRKLPPKKTPKAAPATRKGAKVSPPGRNDNCKNNNAGLKASQIETNRISIDQMTGKALDAQLDLHRDRGDQAVPKKSKLKLVVEKRTAVFAALDAWNVRERGVDMEGPGIISQLLSHKLILVQGMR